MQPAPATAAVQTTDTPRSSQWRDAVAPLRIRNYRLFVGSQIIANTALWMQRVAQDWLVLQLTHNVAMVGMTVAFQFAPMLFFGLFGGVIADRYPKRRLLMMTQSAASTLAIVLATVTLTGVVAVWQVYSVALLLGFVTVVDNPARQVFVNEMVGPAHLRSAISVNSAIFQLGGLVGPAVGGVMIHLVGEGVSFGINGAACAIVVATLSRMRPGELHTSPVVARAKGQLSEGLRYVLATPVIGWTVVLVAFVAVFGMNMPVLLAAFASSVFHLGAGGYGLFNSFVAMGALAGAVSSTRRRTLRLRSLVLAAVAFGMVEMAAGLAPDVIVYAAVLVGVGLATLTFLTGANALIQMTASLAVRGRVMSLYVLVLLGGQSVGSLIMGRICQEFGPRLAMCISGVVPALAAVVVGLMLAHNGHLTVQVNRQHRRPGRYLSVIPREATG